ncbi:MAG: APC family permease [Thermoprotei archaeon]
MSTQGYRKELGLWSIVLLTVGAILGPAVAYIPVTVLADGGPAGMLSWLFALILILPIALVYVELGTMWPRAGGVAYYPARSHGPITGVLNGWAAFVGYSLAMPAVVAAIVEYASYFFPTLYQNSVLTTSGLIVSIIATAIIWLINTRRVRFLGGVNNALTALKTLIVLGVALTLIYFFHPSNLTSYGGFAPYGVGGVFLATSATIFAYAGFRQPIDYAEEVKDPGRIIPRAIVASLLIVFAVYLLESIAFVGTVDWGKLGLNPGDWSSLSNLPYPYASASEVVGLTTLAVVAIVGVVIASFSDGVIYFGGASRVGNALAKYDGYFPDRLSKLNAHGVPFNSTLVVLIVSIIYLVLLPSFASVLSVFVDAVVFSYAPSAVSLLVFRQKNPNERRPYSLPVAKLLSPYAFVVGGLLIFWSGWTYVSISIISVFVGLLLLIFYHKKRRIGSGDIKAGIWLPIYALAVLAMSYVSDKTYLGGRGIIPFPWDNILFIAVTLVFYYWGYRSGLGYGGRGTLD